MKAQTWQFIARHRDHRVARAAAGAARSFLDAYASVANYVIEFDGEARVLSLLENREPCTVLDVGANWGEWTLAAAPWFPLAEFVAFEPSKVTHDRLVAELQPLGDRAVAVNAAVGSEPGVATIHVPSPGSALSSFLDTTDGSAATEEVTVVTVDDYCASRGIENIYFLKVDTEGWDHEVLAGAHDMLSSERVTAVQFEYGPWALETRFLLKDFFGPLGDCGFTVGKIFPRSVEFGDYRPSLEDFRGLNFLAVQRARPELVARLANPKQR